MIQSGGLGVPSSNLGAPTSKIKDLAVTTLPSSGLNLNAGRLWADDARHHRRAARGRYRPMESSRLARHDRGDTRGQVTVTIIPISRRKRRERLGASGRPGEAGERPFPSHPVLPPLHAQLGGNPSRPLLLSSRL
jgi:hypothetical protein